MKLLPREFFERVPVVPEHLKPPVKDRIFASIVLYDFFLTGNLYLRPHPMEHGRTRPHNPEEKEEGSRDDHEPCETPVFAVEYVFYFAQNRDFLYYCLQK